MTGALGRSVTTPEFVTGFACAFRGLARLVTTPVLWGWALAPVALTFPVLFACAKWGHDQLREIAEEWTETQPGGASVTGTAFDVLFWTLFAVSMFFVFPFVVRVVAAPLLALLADRTVAGLSGAPAPAGPGTPLVRWVVRPVAEALLVLALRICVTLVALPLLLVPVAGSLIFAVVMMALLGLDLLDIAQSARGVLLGERLRFVSQHSGACLGLGIGAGLLMLVPCVNVLLLPAIVVGGVLLDSRIAPDFPRAAAA